MSQFSVTAILEEPRFRLGFDRLARAGPLVDATLSERVDRMKQELLSCGGVPPGVFAHSDLDGSYVLAREDIQIRYYVMPSPPESWFRRTFGRVKRTTALRVRIRLQSIEWPGHERLAGS